MAKKTQDSNHFHLAILAFCAILLSVVLLALNSNSQAQSKNNSTNGFDEFGYNYTARTFSAPADGVDRNLDGTVWGDTTYANDHLKMTWSKAWDDARFNGANWTCEAWEDNEWNGNVKNGSGENYHYKIVWVGPTLQNSPCWHQGGSSIWGEFEIIMSQGTINGKHMIDVKADRPGYGAFK